MPETETRTNALHWAAIATGLHRARAAHDTPVTADDKAAYARYIDNAHAHGISDAEIDEYRRTRLGGK